MPIDIQKAKEILGQAEKRIDQNRMVGEISGIIATEIKPVMQELTRQMQESVNQYLQGIKQIKIEAPSVSVNTPDVKVPKIDSPKVEIPEIKIPDINIPEIKLPVINIDTDKISKAIEKAFSKIKIDSPEVKVNIPKIDIPKMKDIVMPEEMKVSGDVGITGIDRDKPLAVIIVDEKGRYQKLSPKISVSGGGGTPITSNAYFNGFSVPPYDYVSVTYPSATTEQYVLRIGGSSGNVNATLLLTYTDATKASLSTVEKT